jgi:hypothetical protein
LLLLLLLLLLQELGIPTANVDADSLRTSIAEAVTGIYCGWASIGNSNEVSCCIIDAFDALGDSQLMPVTGEMGLHLICLCCWQC